MIDEAKLRAKLADLWKKKPPTTPHSFAEAEALIDQVVEASTITVKGKVKRALKRS